MYLRTLEICLGKQLLKRPKYLLLMVGKAISGENKYMKDCDETKELSYLQYWDISN